MHLQSEDFHTDLSIFAVHLVKIACLAERYRTFIFGFSLFSLLSAFADDLKALFLHILLPAVVGKYIRSAEQNTAIIGSVKVFQRNTLIADLLDLTASAVIHDNITNSEIGYFGCFGLFLHKLLLLEKLRHFRKTETVTEICCILAVSGNDDNIRNRKRVSEEIIGTVIIKLSEKCFKRSIAPELSDLTLIHKLIAFLNLVRTDHGTDCTGNGGLFAHDQN